MKSTFGWQAVNETQHTWYLRKNPSDTCPTCKAKTETQDHVYKCNHPASRKSQTQEIDKLGTWLMKQNYHPYITSSIQRNIRAWMDGKTAAEVIILNTPNKNRGKIKKLIDEAVTDQTTIGWQHFTCRRISRKWQRALDAHPHTR